MENTKHTHKLYDHPYLGAVVGCILMVGVAVYLLRKSKWEEIKATWANIWAE